MNYKISEKKIYTTVQYDIFKQLKGNRTVKNGRVVKAMESIQKHGWLDEPILVNENLEIIDGQGRLEALRRLGMPVEFIIQKGIGKSECQALNHYQKNWTTMDYVECYVADNNGNYIWLKNMLRTYTALTKSVIFSVCVSGGRNSSIGSADFFKVIEEGRLNVSNEGRKRAEEALIYLSRFVDTAKHLGGRKDKFYTALMFLYLLDGIDNERLCSVINNARYDGMVSSATPEGYLQQFEIQYNKNLQKSKRIDMMHEYKIA